MMKEIEEHYKQGLMPIDDFLNYYYSYPGGIILTPCAPLNVSNEKLIVKDISEEINNRFEILDL
ncbi:hypothetical protein LCGC14_2752810 [marine sediment metagenome]|uniref:Uncharacterized protein n=1 Tax=marine sediment metagenome TaxID=412755 RepID=A0A0F9BSZ5_9ZZZZ